MAYETIAIRKLTPAIGAEVSGVDLASLSNQQASELHDALMAHHVLFFRDQQMSVDQHKAFGRLFGELLVHPAARAEVEGHPEIRVVHADEKVFLLGGRPGAALGLFPIPHPVATGRRRHRLRQHVSRLRNPVGADQASGRGPVGFPHQRPRLFAA